MYISMINVEVFIQYSLMVMRDRVERLATDSVVARVSGARGQT